MPNGLSTAPHLDSTSASPHMADKHQLLFQAGNWDRKPRVVAKAEWHRGEPFPRVGSSSPISARLLGEWWPSTIGEAWRRAIKEGKNAINWTRHSCHGFRNNEVRL